MTSSIRRVLWCLSAVAAWAATCSNHVCADDWSPLWTTANLSQPRALLAAASVGNEVFFGGGCTGSAASNVVDVYNIATDTWSATSLSQARCNLAATSAGGRVLFGGGNYSTTNSNVVDIYDSSNDKWSTATLTQARWGVTATSAGGKALFAGGEPGDSLMDIYDASTTEWSSTNLSVGRIYVAATSVGNKSLFAGGSTNGGNPPYSSLVDIYDTSNGSWSTTNLPQAGERTPATSCGNKAIFVSRNADGQSSLAEFYDTSAGTWSTANLSQGCTGLFTASIGTKVVFAGGYWWNGSDNWRTLVNIYDTATGLWSTTNMSQARREGAVASVGNKVFMAGGYTDIQGTASSLVDIYTFQSYKSINSTKTFTLVDNTTVSGLMQLNGGSLGLATYTLAVGSMGGNAPIGLSNSTLTTGNDNTSTTYSGAIQGGGQLIKIGSGMLTLTGSDTYTGRTTINQGELVVNGPLVSPVTVNSGGILGGTGNLSNVTVNAGGHLAPGNSPGVLHLSGSLILATGALLDYDLDTPTTSDLISMPTGVLSLSGQQYSDFHFAPTTNFVPGMYTLIDAGTISSGSYLGSTTSGTIGGYPANLAIQGNDLVLYVVPEPGTLALLGGGLIGLAAYAWGRRRRSAQS